MSDLNRKSVKLLISDLLKSEYQHEEPLDRIKIDSVQCGVSVRFTEIEEFIVSRIRNWELESQWGRKGVCIGSSPWIDPDSKVVAALEKFRNFSLICSSDYKGRYLDGDFPQEVFIYAKSLSPSIIDFTGTDKLRSLEKIYKQTGKCFSNSQAGEVATHARVHSKFLVMGPVLEDMRFVPTEVITGSYNFTRNASRCLENVVLIQDKRVATAFTRQWYNMLLIAICQHKRLCSDIVAVHGAHEYLIRRQESFEKEIIDDQERRLAHETLMDALEHEAELFAGVPEEDR